jgi:hypothetical protein
LGLRHIAATNELRALATAAAQDQSAAALLRLAETVAQLLIFG